MKLSAAVRQFLEDCELEQGHSPRTIQNYDHYLGRWLAFTEAQHASDCAEITLDLVRQWRLALAHLGLATKTLNYHLIALRSFLKYLARHDVPTLAAEKIELADTKDPTISFLEPEEIDRLLDAPAADSWQGLRDRAILETLYSTGLRVSELAAMNRDQINLDRGEFGIRGKGGKVRVVFLSESARLWLTRYLLRRTDKDPALYTRRVYRQSQSGKASVHPKGVQQDLRLTVRQIERIVTKYGKLAGIVKPIHPHMLRHTLATDLLVNGADLRSVQEILGHASVTTTQVYTHLTNPRLREVHQAFHDRRRSHKRMKNLEKESK